jgi:FkbM family methyltransferase
LSAISKIFSDLRAIARVSGAPAALAFLGALVVALPEVLRAKNLAAVDRRMTGRPWPFSVQGQTFELDGRFFGGAREIYCRQVYFPTPAFALSPGTTVMDLGANVGLFSILGALVGCKVIAVEAQSGFVRELSDLASSLGVARGIVVEHALVGSGTGLFSESSALVSASHFQGSTPPLVSMTDLLAKHHVDQIDFLKVDIEGSEFDLFRSGDQWLRQIRRIAMEVHPSFGSVSELKATIESQEMTVELRDADRRVVSRIPPAGGYLFARRQATAGVENAGGARR